MIKKLSIILAAVCILFISSCDSTDFELSYRIETSDQVVVDSIKYIGQSGTELTILPTSAAISTPWTRTFDIPTGTTARITVYATISGGAISVFLDATNDASIISSSTADQGTFNPPKQVVLTVEELLE